MVEVVAEADRRESLLLQRRCNKHQLRHEEHDKLCMGLFHASSELERRGLPHMPFAGQPKLFMGNW